MVATCPTSHIFNTGGYYHSATISIFWKSTANNIPCFSFPQVINYDKIPLISQIVSNAVDDVLHLMSLGRLLYVKF